MNLLHQAYVCQHNTVFTVYSYRQSVILAFARIQTKIAYVGARERVNFPMLATVDGVEL